MLEKMINPDTTIPVGFHDAMMQARSRETHGVEQPAQS